MAILSLWNTLHLFTSILQVLGNSSFCMGVLRRDNCCVASPVGEQGRYTAYFHSCHGQEGGGKGCWNRHLDYIGRDDQGLFGFV
jgi:hypothetical protein